ncbi:Release factor glutamine methyltransferase [Streptomyces sp. RB5]|uniref:Release factor glutamine methyltransferase n=1 Tax=Streptomyces smaragdinus TaxID=2585196 RepID=A0A7K0CTL5_9ACTN|nr:class I SAM-dependent methyltransferase [Streptomyces smaragdinus]MQY16809.1 Release factor glutamine methyltransferase [Streptomyces smaragdinus]
MSTLPHAGSAAPLREAALRAGFTADGLLDLLGAPAYAALARGETVPAERATRADDDPAAVLTRLFLLRQAVPRAVAAAALPLDGGWLRTTDDGDVAAVADVRPYAGPDGQDWYVVSDLGCAVGGAAGARGGREDLVLGVGGASTTLAGITVRTPVPSALDVGTGSGIQALHASAHAARVTATDLNPRALAFTRLTLALSGAPEAELLEGSLFEPVGEATYDLIVSNPPFVISPGHRLTYRDGGMAGDELCRTLVGQAAGHLNDGGYCQLLANWEHLDGQDWRERIAGWVPRGCDAWIVQREVQDPTEYAELWLRDAGDHRAVPGEYERRYDAWLAEFERRGVRGVGFGWITLRKTGGGAPSLTVEEWPHAVEQPLGPAVSGHFERAAWLRGMGDDTLLAGHYTVAGEVVQEQLGRPGEEDPEHVVLRSGRGMRRATRADTVGAALVGACDGTLSAGRILDAIAQLLGEDPGKLRETFPARLRELVAEGFLEPVATGGGRGPRAMRAQGRPEATG